MRYREYRPDVFRCRVNGVGYFDLWRSLVSHFIQIPSVNERVLSVPCAEHAVPQHDEGSASRSHRRSNSLAEPRFNWNVDSVFKRRGSSDGTVTKASGARASSLGGRSPSRRRASSSSGRASPCARRAKKPSSTQLRLMNTATLLTNIPRPPTLNHEMPTRLEAWPDFSRVRSRLTLGATSLFGFEPRIDKSPIDIDGICALRSASRFH